MGRLFFAAPLSSTAMLQGMSHFVQICTSSLGRKYIMALTGLLLGSFLVFHAVGNSLIFQGREVFIAYAKHLRSLGPLLPIAGLFLLAVFLLHIVTGISLFFRNRKAKSGRYAVSKLTLEQTWAARTMPYTGLINLAFLLLHLATVRFTDQAIPVAERVSRVLTNPLLAPLYAVGIMALVLHISHGFWSLLQTVGINHPGWNIVLRGGSLLISCLVLAVFLGIIVYVNLYQF
jgi:succinate dehydrogenase / fumarate reductase cytochrome b subunit